jgi:ABC-type phosphonate transport system ATPase subunit
VDDGLKRELGDRFEELALGVKERRKKLKNEARQWLRDLEIETERSRQVGEVIQGGVSVDGDMVSP